AVFQDLVVAVVGKFQRCPAGGCPHGPVVAGAGGVGGGGVQGGADVGEGGVDVVRYRKLQHTAHDLAHAPQDGYIVGGSPRVGVNVGVVHHHFHQVAAGSVP